MDLHVLPLCDTNIVLGVQWLKALGPVLTDYNDLSMKFVFNGILIELKGNSDNALLALTPSQLQRLNQTHNASEYFHIRLCSSVSPSPPTHPAILTLTHQLSSLFQTPTFLPPSRTTNHSIHLSPYSSLVNVCPYRYPHFQKQEIESQVSRMLQHGIICPSTSPFFSPVLLVKKRDGTWRFCVDYRALNVITIMDRFSIPTVDELLGELGGAWWFSKLDLLQGYHQILMTPADVSKTAFRTHHNHYEFLVMPFGLCNTPSSFQATMNTTFGPYLRKFIIIFFDDILIYSKSFSDHLEHLKIAFQTLSDHSFFLKLSKCSLATQ